MTYDFYKVFIVLLIFSFSKTAECSTHEILEATEWYLNPRRIKNMTIKIVALVLRVLLLKFVYYY